MFNRRKLPRQLRRLQSRRERIREPYSMPLVRQIEILMHDAYEDTSLTTTHLMSIIVVCVMYLRSQAMPDFLRDKLVNSVDFAEHVMSTGGLLNPRTLKRWHLDLATRNPEQEGREPTIEDIVADLDIPDDISELDDE